MNRITLALVAAGLCLSGCARSEPPPDVDFTTPIALQEVRLGTIEERVVGTATLRAVRAVNLTVQHTGTLRVARGRSGFPLAEGEWVESGDAIATVSGDDVRMAARTEATLSRYQAGASGYAMKQRLFAEGLISRSDMEQAEATLAEAKGDLERSRFVESGSELVTPIAGVILRLARDERSLPLADGQLVHEGFAIAQIGSIDRLIAEVDIPVADLAKLRPGQTVVVRHNAWQTSSFTGRVLRLLPALDAATHALCAEVDVNNHRRLLRPGMFVEATIIVERRTKVPVVVREAVVDRGGSSVVFVLAGQHVVRREVTLGSADGGVVEIKSGLEAGERVAVRGLATLSDGTRVRIIEG